MRVWLQPTLACATMVMFGLEQASEKWATPTFLNNGLVALPSRPSVKNVSR